MPSLCLTWPYLYKLPSTIHICANCTQEHNVFFRGCPVYKFESEVAALHFKHGLTLKEARQEARLNGFQQVPLSQRISINTPQTTTNTDSHPTTSHPSSTHITSSPIPVVPSSSTITSSTSLTHPVVTSVQVNNNFSLLNPDIPISTPSTSNLISLPRHTPVPNTKRHSCASPPKHSTDSTSSSITNFFPTASGQEIF